MDAVSIGVGVVSWNTVANLVSVGIISENSVIGSTAVSTVVSSQGTRVATGRAGRTGEGSVGVGNLEESSCADTLSIGKSSVISGIARCAGSG